MRFNLISNIGNGVGLQRDYELLRGELESLGHDVSGVQFNRRDVTPAADVNIFLEVVETRFFPSAPRQWVIPNPEWWFPGWDALLPQFEKVLAKTRHCQRVFSRKTERCEFLGWCSRDLFKPEIQREIKFLHLAGKSQTKNTEAVVRSWRESRPGADLTVISECHRPRPTARVQWFQRVSEEDLALLMNSHLFHIMPSAYEGWGHALHEALGVGAVVITTNAPPMNEIGAPFLIPPSVATQHNSVPIHKVTPSAVAGQVVKALAASPEVLDGYRGQALATFHAEQVAWRMKVRELTGAA